MTKILSSMFVILFVCIVLAIDAAQLGMKVVNQAGAPVELFWVNTFKPTRDLIPQTKKPLRNNSVAKINTYESHQFMVRWMKHIPGTEVNFTAGNVDETVEVKLDDSTGQLWVNKHDRRQDLAMVVEKARESCDSNKSNDLKVCLVSELSKEVKRIEESKKLIEQYRSLMVGRLRNYTCGDETLESTEAIKTYDYRFLDKQYKVHVYLDTDEGKIWSIENFLMEDECKTLIDTTKDRLDKATVAGDDGGSTYSETRRAQQAGYNFDSNFRDDPLWNLYDRVIKHINFHSELSIGPEGQEGIVVIQYNPGDEYISHCDGTCDGSQFVPAARVATSVLYCKVAEKGGGTSFTKANIFLKPKPLMATFFSYKGSNGKFDNGLTEHSGCPVVAGEKWIATTWLREGVSRENSWEHYDPSGIPLLESNDKIPNEQDALLSTFDVALPSNHGDEL